MQDIPSIGQAARTIFVVTIKDLGSTDANQGPFEVSGTEPQFAQYAYQSGSLDTNIYLDDSCRLVATNSSQLICAQTTYLGGGAACDQESPGVIVVYQKQ